jgi:RNA-binding protein 25
MPPNMPPATQGGFRPPMPGMPPPTLAPGSVPPFPPGQAGFRPPVPGSLPNFPPTRPPFPGAPGLGAPSPGSMPPFSPGMRPPGFSPHGGPGLGTPGGFDPNTGLPRPPNFLVGGANPNFVKAVKTTKVFVGGIAPGVTDAILTGLFHVSSCFASHTARLKPGPYHRRVDRYINSIESRVLPGNNKHSDSQNSKIQRSFCDA